MQLRFGSAMSFDNRLIVARCIGRAWSLGEAFHSQNERYGTAAVGAKRSSSRASRPTEAKLKTNACLLRGVVAAGDNYQSVRIGEGFDAAIRVGYLADSNLSLGASARFRAKTVASPAYLESHGIPKTPEELIDHACLMHGTESRRFVSGTSAAG